MTEAEWMACADPTPMLDFLRGRGSDRKLRLFSCACCRRIWPFLLDERRRRVVEVAEQYVEGKATGGDLYFTTQAIGGPILPSLMFSSDYSLNAVSRVAYPFGAPDTIQILSYSAAKAAAVGAGIGYAETLKCPPRDVERAVQSDLLRCIFGTLFRPVVLNPLWLAWNDGAIQKMAHVIYADRTFDCLPLLADALEDAGCTDSAILGHCRDGGEHVRGCWVVDLLLGKQ